MYKRGGLGFLVCASCAGWLAAQPYRIISSDHAAYTVSVKRHKLIIQPSAAPAVMMSIISSETAGVSHTAPDPLDGSAIERYSVAASPASAQTRVLGASTETDYLGPLGSVFSLKIGPQMLVIEYPNLKMKLRLTVSLGNTGVRVDEAHYAGEGDLSSLCTKYLRNWQSKLPGEIAVARGSLIQLDVPHPSSKAALDPGEQEYFSSSQASTAIGRHTYYSLKIVSTPARARVYVGGNYIGLAGSNIRAESPAKILIRFPGYQDVAENVELGDGPNEIMVTLARSRSR